MCPNICPNREAVERTGIPEHLAVATDNQGGAFRHFYINTTAGNGCCALPDASWQGTVAKHKTKNLSILLPWQGTTAGHPGRVAGRPGRAP